MKIQKSDLGPLDEIAAGAFGCVYRASSFSLPGDPEPLAYKEFTTDHAHQVQAARAVVGLWNQLDASERADLARYAAWPRALVHDGGSVCGLLMPLIPNEFFCNVVDAASGRRVSRPREMSWLIATEAQRIAAGVDIPDIDLIDRHVLLAKLTYVLGLLHRRGWVYGDLSFKNVAIALEPPRLILLDCDGAAPLADRTRKQSHTPFWEPPECKSGQQRLQDEVTDVYKLGLAIIRCLTPGKGAATSSDPARVSAELDAIGRGLVARAVDADRSGRPTAKDLYADFQRLLSGRVARPVVHEAVLATPLRLRGQDVLVEWEVERADEIVIHAANGQRVTVDPQSAPSGLWFRPDSSGPVALEVRNRFGSVVEEIGEITLYELPQFDIGDVRLPQPAVPGMAPVMLHPASELLAERPVAGVGIPVAALPTPDLVDLIARVAPAGRALPPLPRFDEAVGAVGGGIRNLVTNGGAELSTTLNDAIARAFPDLASKERSR